MVRRSAGFVSKKPHRKSKGGCTTCKRKKVKCDELSPRCSYCKQRNLDCIYLQEKSRSHTPEDSDSIVTIRQNAEEDDFKLVPLQTPAWLSPVALTSSGGLSKVDLELLHHYKTSTWQTLTVREDEVIRHLNREWVPQKGLSHSYLLYAILSIAASHIDTLNPSPQTQALATMYRQKTLASYNKALQNITNDNYETLLLTSVFMQVMVPPPQLPCTDTSMLNWVSVYLSMTQGLRVLASLKWACGIEKLDVFPVFRRELYPLPSPPDLAYPPEEYWYPHPGPPGNTPEHPDPPVMYTASKSASPSPSPVNSGVDVSANLSFRPKELMRANPLHTPPSWNKPLSWQLPAPAFLPPPLLALLRSIAEPSTTGPIDLHRPTLVPVLHALSPIFLSLYYYHLSPDFYLRTIVYPTFLMPEFLALVKNREPRSLVIMGWWFAFVRLIPNIWWVDGVILRILQAVSNEIMRSGDASGSGVGVLMDAVDGAFRVVKVAEKEGSEGAARSVFVGWEGVYWEKGGRGYKVDVGGGKEGGSKAFEDDVVDWDGGGC